jgi:hypothetical protein
MSQFDPIVSGTVTFTPVDDGVYSDSSVTFQDPQHLMKFKGVSQNRSGSHSGSIVYNKQVEAVNPVTGATSLPTMSFVCQVSLTKEFSEAEVKDAIRAVYDWSLVAGNVDRWLNGAN